MKIYSILFIFYLSSIYSQSLDQIKEAKKLFKNSGMTVEQAKSAAKSRGYNEKQINDAIQKDNDSNNKSIEVGRANKQLDIEKSDKSINVYQDNENNRNLEESNSSVPPIIDENLQLQEVIGETKPDLIINENIPFFGYHIFKRDPSIFQASSVGAVDPDYVIGPGDEIIVMLWGETQFRQVLSVDREGFIFIPEVGQVFVNGLNLNLLESKLYRVLSKSYASLNTNSGKATSFLDISLGNLRPLRIQVLGQVRQPGAYIVSPSTSLFSALYYFNGPNELGSLRDIQLIRGNKQVASIDFYDFLLTGKKPKDQRLQLDDVIFIPNRGKTILLSGEINKPGIYELKENEKLVDLISIAGGLKTSAYLDRAQIDRIVPFEMRDIIKMDRMISDVNLGEVINSNEPFELEDGDNIQIFSILESRENIIQLSGAVTRPGNYDMGDSLSLSELINKANGLLGDAYMERVDVIRIKPDLNEELIKLDLKKVLDKNPLHDISLQSFDNVIVYSTTEMIERQFVTINGHVKKPGKFALQENMTLFDLIFKSGGFIDEAFKKNTYMERGEIIRFIGEKGKKIISFNLRNVLNKQGLAFTLLKNGDAIRIYSNNEIKGETQYVSIEGHVKNPGRYELYKANMTLYDLIFKSGGFQDPQFKAQTFLDRADLLRFKENRILKTIISFNLGSLLEDSQSDQNLFLKPGDKVRVYAQDVFKSASKVTIVGSIRSPGEYLLKSGMTMKDLILEAGGLLENVFEYKIEVSRIDPNETTEDIFAEIINLSMMDDYSISNNGLKVKPSSDIAENNDFLLMAYDYINVRVDPYFRMQQKVMVEGAINYPGEYMILSSNESISDIIQRAGGIRGNAFLFGSSFIRNGKRVQVDMGKIIKNPGSKIDIKVLNNDKIVISEKPNLIELVGEVKAPGYYKFEKGSRVKSIINQAGGFTENAELNSVFITYANGVSKEYRPILRNHKVFDGSIITVRKKKEEEPFDKTEYAKELTSIIASITQILAVYLLALNPGNST